MPLIDIQVIEGVFNGDEKADLIAAVTKGFGDITGQVMVDATSVRIQKIKNGAWGYGGRPIYL